MKRKEDKEKKVLVVATNRKARRDYFIEETYEAGISLLGSEVKSLREGRVSLDEGYCGIEGREVFLYEVNIAPYSKGSVFLPSPRRKRKLLLHKHEISRLYGKVERRGYTLIPLKLYFNPKGIAKLEIALVKGKKEIDRREELRRRAMERAERIERKYG